MAKKVLIVDDESDILAVTRKRIESSGYETVIVENAEDALDYLAGDLPDLILLDLLLPKMQGGEFCKIIKSEDRLKNIPIILYTASAGDMPKFTREVGADDYIIKPFEPEELLGKIAKFIG